MERESWYQVRNLRTISSCRCQVHESMFKETIIIWLRKFRQQDDAREFLNVDWTRTGNVETQWIQKSCWCIEQMAWLCWNKARDLRTTVINLVICWLVSVRWSLKGAKCHFNLKTLQVQWIQWIKVQLQQNFPVWIAAWPSLTVVLRNRLES